MPNSKQSSEVGAIPTVTYGSDAFARAAQEFASVYRSSGGARVVFHGGTSEQRQLALATLKRHTTDTVHQFRIPSLLAERRMQTQNSLRKAFDHAAEEGALLYFGKVDALFDWDYDEIHERENEAEPTAVEYFFQRVESYMGVVVLCLQKKAHIDRARRYDLHLIVEFE